jgi:hypothetical protein
MARERPVMSNPPRYCVESAYAALRMFSMIAVAARAGSTLLTIGRPMTR